MSRSYKKTPVMKQRSSTYIRFAKKQANKKVRKTGGLSNGKQYRKYYESRDIYDFISYTTKTEYLQSWKKENSFLKRIYPTLDEAIQGWRKSYYLK